MYRAIITDKSLANGMLHVTVYFTDDRDSFSEVFQTNQQQSFTWIEEQINRKLEHLNSLPTLLESISLGTEITQSQVVDSDTVVLDERAQYEEDLKRFEKFVGAVSKGLTTAENEDFKQLKDKLTANFKSDYLDLF